MKIREILTRYWGYYSFRPMQEEVIQSVLSGKDALALFPTGGGKSLCYQVPAMALEGLTLVVSPLIALMRDQVSALRERQIKADAIFSGMHPEEIHMVYSNAIHGGTKLLYVSPERLKTDSFRENLPYLNIDLIAVDEAHCISQWGYDFRPPYREIAEIRDFIPRVPVLALTATATPRVVDDIMDQLRFTGRTIFQRSFKRDNLTYVVLKEQDKLKRVERMVKNVGGSGIVYVRSRKKTVEYARMLSSMVSVDFYHAGLDMKERNLKQKNWMDGKTKLMVSTNAFGMGIDKPDVRYVVHMDVPDAIESYFQEAGRAGRDGKQSYATILYDQNDIERAKESLEQSYPKIEYIKKVYDALGNYFQVPLGSMQDRSFDMNVKDFADRYGWKTLDVFHALRFLEKDGYILMNNSLKNASRVFISESKETLYKFQFEYERYDRLIKVLLRSYSGLFTQYAFIDEKTIAQRADMEVDQVVKALKFMQQQELLKYIPSSGKPQLIFTQPRLESQNVLISSENYHHRLEQDRKRLDAMLDYLETNSKCRSQQLLAYFGESASVRCGKCDVCLRRNKVDMSRPVFDEIVKKIRPSLLNDALTEEEMEKLLTVKEAKQLTSVLRFLTDSNKIAKDGTKFFWKKPDE